MRPHLLKYDVSRISPRGGPRFFRVKVNYLALPSISSWHSPERVIYFPLIHMSCSSRRAELAAALQALRASTDRIRYVFEPVELEEYKDPVLGPTYYDSMDAVAAAVATAAEEAERFRVSRDRVKQLVQIYNVYVPWVLSACGARLDTLENSERSSRDATSPEEFLSAAEESVCKISHTLECLAANVDEACTFLGKVGRTKEGAHDAGEIELASTEVIDAASSRRVKAKRTKGIVGGRSTSPQSVSPKAAEATVFFQKQRGAFCGVCALNNMLGRRAISYRESELLADTIWLKSVLLHGCGIHFPAPRLHSRRREFPYDGFME